MTLNRLERIKSLAEQAQRSCKKGYCGDVNNFLKEIVNDAEDLIESIRSKFNGRNN